MASRWRRRARTWLRVLVYAMVVTVPPGVFHHWIYGTFQHLASTRWGRVADWLLPIVGHPWFPWALPPLAILALILKEFLENPNRVKSDRVARFAIAGQGIRSTILGAEESKKGEWEPMVAAWMAEVRTWLEENDSLARAVFVAAPVLEQYMVQHLYQGRTISDAKEGPIQRLEEYLKRLDEIQAQYREEERR